MKKQKPIIIKKVKKGGHGGHHGGAWKVAYADFVTAMMAFFLLMWLLNMTSEEKRIRLSMYFKHFSLFQDGGTSIMGKTSSIMSEAGPTQQQVFKEQGDVILNKDFEKSIEESIGKELGSAKDQVIVDVVKEGIRIQLIDKEGSLMFEKGSNKLTPKGKAALRVIAERISDMPNRVIVEGHTDAVPFEKKDYGNWELSTERASTARRTLESNGVSPDRIARVSGFAGTIPLIEADAADPRNRRISIIVKHSEKRKKLVFAPKRDNRQIAKQKEGSPRSEKAMLLQTGKVKSVSDMKEIDKNRAKIGIKKKTRNWSPQIRKDGLNPIIQDEMSPILKKGNDITIKEWNRDNGLDTKDAMIKNLLSRPGVTAPAQTEPTDTTVIEKETAPPDESSETQKVIDDLQNPIIPTEDIFK